MQNSDKVSDPIDTDSEAIDGDPLAGSGFETEETEPDFDDFTERGKE